MTLAVPEYEPVLLANVGRQNSHTLAVYQAGGGYRTLRRVLKEMTPAEVQDTLSCYGFFKQDRPAGRTRVWVCRSLSCAARGGESLLDYLVGKLGIQPGQTTPDGRVSLEFAECLGACDFAPAMLAGDVLHKNLTREKIDQFVESLNGKPG